jgi:predicted outer membrane repeat protein
MQFSRWIFPLLLIALASAAFADTTWVDTSAVWGEWTGDHSPYVIRTNIHVAVDSTLHIGPGVTVFFAGDYSLLVSQAHFSATGSEQDSVYFTTDTAACSQRWGGIALFQFQPLDTVTLDYCVIENTGGQSGSMRAALRVGGGNLSMRHSTVRSCIQAQDGTIYVGDSGTRLDFASCDFIGNRSNGSSGVLGTYADFTRLVDCRFERNTSQNYGGGAVDFWSPETLSIVNCVFRNNSSTQRGGAVLLEAGFTEITGCAFDTNAAEGIGGGIAALPTASLLVSGCTFSGNHATLGGAICAEGDTTVIAESVLSGNTAEYGGAVYIVSNPVPVIRSCTIAGNTADAHAGGIYCHGATPSLVNTAIAFNAGEGVQFDGSLEHSIHHNLFFGNSLGPFLTTSGPDTLAQLARTNFNGDSSDAYFNLYLDPLFADTAAANYHLTNNSPCIDAGDSTFPRDPDSTIADIGAYHLHRIPSAANPQFIPYPLSLSLSSYPNPFNAVVTIRYDMPASGRASLKVYDLTGREVRTLVDKQMAAGSYSIYWNAENLPSGMYFVMLKATGQQRIQKVLLLK